MLHSIQTAAQAAICLCTFMEVAWLLPTQTQVNKAEELPPLEQQEPAQADSRDTCLEEYAGFGPPALGPRAMTGAQSFLSPGATPQSQHKLA